MNNLGKDVGVTETAECFIICHTAFNIFHGSSTTACGPQGLWSSIDGKWEESMLVLAEGEEAGEMVTLVEVFDY